MAASDAHVFPVQNVAFRQYICFRDNTGELVTGWTVPSCVISIDGAASIAGPTPVEDPSADGMGWIDLSAGNMNGRTIGIVATITNAGAKKYVAFLTTGGLSEITGAVPASATVAASVWAYADPGDSASRATMGGMFAWLYRRFFNKHYNDGLTLIVYKDDSTTTETQQAVTANSIGKGA